MDGTVHAVNGISYTLEEGQTLGIVGESGCGKSVSALSVMGLIPKPPGKITAGQVLYRGQDLLSLREEEMEHIRGDEIAMVFQDPMTSLNPVLTIGHQIGETLVVHQGAGWKEAQRQAVEMLERVGIAQPVDRYDNYPHQLSGGMRQRVMISMALANQPEILIADEPTTAADVTTEARLLELMKDLVARINTALIIVTQNLGVLARYAKRIYVMYAGRIVESGPSEVIFNNPRHPYTLGLLRSVPRLGENRSSRKLAPIHGSPPDLIKMSPYCAFLPRCIHKTERCEKDPWPALRQVGEGHYISCYADLREIL